MSDDDDTPPGEEYNLLMSLCPPSVRERARNLLADCNALWADEIDDDTNQPEETS